MTLFLIPTIIFWLIIFPIADLTFRPWHEAPEGWTQETADDYVPGKSVKLTHRDRPESVIFAYSTGKVNFCHRVDGFHTLDSAF